MTDIYNERWVIYIMITRMEYLEDLADKYDLPLNLILIIAVTMWPRYDFWGLVKELRILVGAIPELEEAFHTIDDMMNKPSYKGDINND